MLSIPEYVLALCGAVCDIDCNGWAERIAKRIAAIRHFKARLHQITGFCGMRSHTMLVNLDVLGVISRVTAQAIYEQNRRRSKLPMRGELLCHW